jgi:osmoprotectant transport system permease protein
VIELVSTPPNWSGRTLAGNWDVIWYYTLVHIRYTIVALALGVGAAFPMAFVAYRWPRTYPPLLALTNVLYAIPSIAMFILLAPWLGFTNDRPVVVAMAIYTLVILLRNIVEGLRAAPRSVIDAATAMGYRPLRRFVAVELPLATPSIVAGLRVSAVSTISLISVAAVVGRGGLGRLFDDGFTRNINVQVWAGLGAIVVLALAVDALIVFGGRLLTPWTRAQVRAPRRATP